jgi:hypothetical protein
MASKKREILQAILDEIEPNWTIYKPSADDDVETKCIFQHAEDYRQAEVSIPNEYFLANDLLKIQELVQWSVANARKV